MKYITHRRFKDQAILGYVNIPAMTECEEHNGMIFHNGKPICLATSENAHTYFAINEDGKGMERGASIRFIMSTLMRKDEKQQARWDKVWEDERCQKYKRPEHPDHWLWNHDFYNADLDDLKHIEDLIREV